MDLDQLINTVRIFAFKDNAHHSLDVYQRLIQADPDNVDAWKRLGFSFLGIREFDNAIRAYNQVLKLSETHNDQENIAWAYGNIGNVYTTRGDLDKAIEFHEKALKLNEEREYKKGVAQNYAGLGNVYKKKGDKERALDYLEKSVELYKQIGSPMKNTVQKWINVC